MSQLNVCRACPNLTSAFYWTLNDSTGLGEVQFDVLSMATITDNIVKTYCTPCAKAVDYFTGGRGRELHHIVEPVPTVQQTDPISSLPLEIQSKIFSYVGSGYDSFRSFDSVARVCRAWWTLAYGDRQQHFSEKVVIYAHSSKKTTPMRLAIILSVCHNQVRKLNLDFYDITPSNTITITAESPQTLDKLKFLANTSFPKLREYHLRVSQNCNEPDQCKHVMSFFDRSFPTLLEVSLDIKRGTTHEQLSELMAAVSRSDNVVKIKLNYDLDTSLGMPLNAKRNFRMPV